MSDCPEGNVNFRSLQGVKYSAPPPGLFVKELTSIAQSGASGAALPTMRLTDAGAELEQVRKVAASFGGVPVVVAIAFRFTQTVAATEPAGATAGRVVSFPFRERRARTTVIWAPGNKGDVYFRTRARSVGLINDVMCFSVAPGIMRATFDLLGVPWGERSSWASEQQATGYGVNPKTVNRPLYGFAPPQYRICYNGSSAVAEPVDGSAYGDIMVLPLTMDGAKGDVSLAGIQLAKITDLEQGAWTWRFTLQDETGLYYDDGATATFGTTTVTPILIYRVERGERIVEGEVWEDTEGLLPVTDNVNTTFGAADVQGLTFMGWRTRVQTDDTDAGNNFLVDCDTGPTPHYLPYLRCVQPNMNVAANLYTQGTYLRIGDGVIEEFPNDPQALGVRAITDFNTANRFDEMLRESDSPREAFFAELTDFNASGARASATALTAGGYALLYGDRNNHAPVSTIRSTATAYRGGLPDASLTALPAIGGLLAYPFAYSNPQQQSFPGLAGRTPGDGRLIMVTKVGNFAAPVYTNGGSSVTWPTAITRKRGAYDACTSRDANPIPAGGTPVLVGAQGDQSPKRAIGSLLTPSVVVSKGIK